MSNWFRSPPSLPHLYRRSGAVISNWDWQRERLCLVYPLLRVKCVYIWKGQSDCENCKSPNHRLWCLLPSCVRCKTLTAVVARQKTFAQPFCQNLEVFILALCPASLHLITLHSYQCPRINNLIHIRLSVSTINARRNLSRYICVLYWYRDCMKCLFDLQIVW